VEKRNAFWEVAVIHQRKSGTLH